jgi:hypothetical protein
MVRRFSPWMVCAAVLIACGPPSGGGASARIARQVDTHVRQVIDLRDALPGPWTRLFIFGPYTTQAQAEKALGRPWPYKWGAIESLDDRAFFVFMDSSRIVAAFDQLYEHGLFVDPHGWAGYPRDSVRFIVRDRGKFPNGVPYREVEWVP